MNEIFERIASVRARIAAACARAGRAPGGVRLVVVTKGVPVERVADAVALGERDLGENRVQELLEKQAALPDLLAARGIPPERAPRWHMIGTVQRNKVRRLVNNVDLVHSLDSVELIETIAARARARGAVQAILLEVNTSEERTKHGFRPEEAMDAARIAAGTHGVLFRGLMTIAPQGDDPAARNCFRMLRRIRDAVDFCDPASLELSMGMSGDFEIAVEEGATLVRVGTAVFGPRDG